MRIMALAYGAAFLFGSTLVAESRDTQSDSLQPDTAVYILEHTVLVVGTRLTRTQVEFPFEKDRFATVLQSRGYTLIPKGVFLAQDVASGGFKRGDITMTIDGERYHSACPNRMDSPLARTNALEMDAIDLQPSSAGAQSGIGGSVEFHRERPADSMLVRVGVGRSFDASSSGDHAVSVNRGRHRLAGRFARGRGYVDGDGKSFKDRYGYKGDESYLLAEGALTGELEDLSYRVEYTHTEDVLFPYLMMDERENRVVSAHAAHAGHKLYITYTDHLMDNGLRVSPSAMTTDAENLTVGLTGPFYEAYYRRWDTYNRIVNPMTTINNHIVPEARQVSASVFRRMEMSRATIWGRLGVVGQFMGDQSRLDFLQELHPEASDSRAHVTFAIGTQYRPILVEDMATSVALDAVAEPPALENLYIAQQTMPGHPWWAGNPELRLPVRVSVRPEIRWRELTLGGSAAHVWDYPDLTGAVKNNIRYRTYRSINALLLGAFANGSWRHLEFSAGYTWARNEHTDSALVEVAPFFLITTLKSPSWKRLNGFARWTYNDAQTRVDRSLSETPSTSWHRFDIGATMMLRAIRLSLEVLNVADELYYQHLGYLRNPYSSGARVYEPGRTVSLTLTFDSSLPM